MAYSSSESPRARLFLGLVRDGRSLKWSARTVGVHLWTGYRWLGERYCQLRAEGLVPDAALKVLGCRSAKAVEWEALHQSRGGLGPRHHLSVEIAVEQVFWAAFGAGLSVSEAAESAGVGKSTGYRWWRRRFVVSRDAGMSMADAMAMLRVPPARAASWETAQRADRDQARRAREAELRRAVRASALQDERIPRPGRRPGAAARRDARYWELMRQGLTNTDACTVLGVSRRVGTRIRRNRDHQTAPPVRAATPSGRYLSLRERLQIADLTLMGQSMRQIAAGSDAARRR